MSLPADRRANGGDTSGAGTNATDGPAGGGADLDDTIDLAGGRGGVAPDDLVAAIDAALDAGAGRPGSWREALALGQRLVHERFEAGAPASVLLAARTAVVDRVLTRSWAGEGAPFDTLGLLAVGGYGRGELHPASDVDLAVLVPEGVDAALERRLAAWITGLWDLGIDISHSVRSIAECEREAAADLTVVTNLMEARPLCGDPALYEAVQRVIAPTRMWPPAAFLAAKLDEQTARRARFHTNAYRLEPNVKESLGGLRDFQTLAWVCRRQFGRAGLEPLVEAGLLEPDELAPLTEGLELLWRVRYLLHHLAGRQEDRLLFDYQRDVAHAFGYTDDGGNRAIEALMQRYYRTVMTLQRLAEIVLQGLGGIIAGSATAPLTPLGPRFRLRNGFIAAAHESVFLRCPAALLEIFLVFGDTPGARGLRSDTVRLIRKHLGLIDERFRADPAARALFLSIFQHPAKLTRTIRMMNRYGVMAAYLPAFDAIVGRMQYDLFHVYTVDEHTIHVIRNLRRFTLPAHAGEFPHCSAVAARLADPATLYLSGLFHDIAKGRGGDHSELGAEEAAAFAAGHGLEPRAAELLVWTVRHHLLMSMTAQGKDIDDPGVQLDFARTVGSLERLDHLYLLSVADIRATNPELWNSFKESLLRSLHRHARLILERGLDDPLGDDDIIRRRQERALALLDEPCVADSRRGPLWQGLGAAYFRQYQPPEIARHTEILLAGDETPEPLVALRRASSRGSTEVLIHMRDDEALFARITTVLDTLSLSVLSATINTTAAGYALDTFNVLEADGTLVARGARTAQVRLALLHGLGGPKDLPALAPRRPSRRLRHFDVSTDVVFGDDDAIATELRITAADRPGTLSRIGRILLRAGVSVRSARIATLGERIDDVFFIGMPGGGAVHDPEVRARLIALLREGI